MKLEVISSNKYDLNWELENSKHLVVKTTTWAFSECLFIPYLLFV